MGARHECIDDPDQYDHQCLFHDWGCSGGAETGDRVRREIPGIPTVRFDAFPLAMAESED